MSYDEFLRGIRDVIAPARTRGVHGRAPGLRGRGVRRPGDRVGRRRARRARPGARAADRLRHGAAHAHDRPRHRRARQPAGRASSTRRCWRRCGSPATRSPGARRPPHAVVNDAVELVRDAGLAARDRASRTPSRAGSPRASPRSSRRCRPGRSPSRYPDWIYETWVRDWGEEEALALMRAQNEPAELVVRSDGPGRRADRRPRRLPPRAGRARGPGGGPDLAEPRLAARRARRRLARRRADPRRLRRPRRQDDDAPRRGDRGRAPPRPRPRARGERPPARRDERPRRQRRRPRARRARLRPRARRRAVLGPRRPRPPARPALARDRRCPACSSSCSARPPSARGRAGRSLYSVCTLNADENEAVVDALGPRAGAARRGVAGSSRTRSGRSSCSRRRTGTARQASSSPGSASDASSPGSSGSSSGDRRTDDERPLRPRAGGSGSTRAGTRSRRRAPPGRSASRPGRGVALHQRSQRQPSSRQASQPSPPASARIAQRLDRVVERVRSRRRARSCTAPTSAARPRSSTVAPPSSSTSSCSIVSRDARRLDPVGDLGEEPQLEAVARLLGRRRSLERDAARRRRPRRARSARASSSASTISESCVAVPEPDGDVPAVPSSFGPATSSTTASSPVRPRARSLRVETAAFTDVSVAPSAESVTPLWTSRC